MWTSLSSLTSSLRCVACFSLFLGVASVAPAAEETPFVTGLSAEERAAIGLNSLTPAQRTALEKAVERYVAGRSEVLVAETATDIRSAMAAEMTEQQQKRLDAEEALAAAQAELAAKQQESDAALATAQAEFARKEQELAAKEQAMITAQDDDTSLLERARVLLTPGTKIEFATVNSTMIDEFKGWNEGTIFRLENGQNWRVTSGKYWSPREAAGKAVSIEPGSFGSFHIRIEGIKPTPKVELISRN